MQIVFLYIFMIQLKMLFGNIHSGWKGTYNEIAKKAVEKLKEEFNVSPKDLIVCIGPSIKNCCFEVEEDIKNMFFEKFKYTQRIDEIIKKSKNNNKYYIDTVLINKIILKIEGLKESNIIDSMLCTRCNADKLHSYRKDKELSGRNTAIISLKMA